MPYGPIDPVAYARMVFNIIAAIENVPVGNRSNGMSREEQDRIVDEELEQHRPSYTFNGSGAQGAEYNVNSVRTALKRVVRDHQAPPNNFNMENAGLDALFTQGNNLITRELWRALRDPQPSIPTVPTSTWRPAERTTKPKTKAGRRTIKSEREQSGEQQGLDRPPAASGKSEEGNVDNEDDDQNLRPAQNVTNDNPEEMQGEFLSSSNDHISETKRPAGRPSGLTSSSKNLKPRTSQLPTASTDEDHNKEGPQSSALGQGPSRKRLRERSVLRGQSNGEADRREPQGSADKGGGKGPSDDNEDEDDTPPKKRPKRADAQYSRQPPQGRSQLGTKPSDVIPQKDSRHFSEQPPSPGLRSEKTLNVASDPAASSGNGVGATKVNSPSLRTSANDPTTQGHNTSNAEPDAESDSLTISNSSLYQETLTAISRSIKSTSAAIFALHGEAAHASVASLPCRDLEQLYTETFQNPDWKQAFATLQAENLDPRSLFEALIWTHLRINVFNKADVPWEAPHQLLDRVDADFIRSALPREVDFDTVARRASLAQIENGDFQQDILEPAANRLALDLRLILAGHVHQLHAESCRRDWSKALTDRLRDVFKLALGMHGHLKSGSDQHHWTSVAEVQETRKADGLECLQDPPLAVVASPVLFQVNADNTRVLVACVPEVRLVLRNGTEAGHTGNVAENSIGENGRDGES